jgi:hypothetical protein
VSSPPIGYALLPESFDNPLGVVFRLALDVTDEITILENFKGFDILRPTLLIIVSKKNPILLTL